jgi:hypothetical protein
MSEKNIKPEEKTIVEIGDEIRDKLVRMQKSEGAEIEISEIDLDGVSGGWECSYKTAKAN